MRGVRLAGAGFALLGIVLPSFGATPADAQIRVGLVPFPPVTTVGEAVEVEVRLLDATPGVNAYELELSYDPERLEILVQEPLGDQEGPLMTDACPDRWHRFETGAGSAIVSHAVLCPGSRVEGPGALYRLRFRTRMPGETGVRVERVRLVDGGTELGPVESTSARITVSPPVPALNLRARPNPFRTDTRWTIGSPAGGEGRIVILSARGARIRTVPVRLAPGETREVVWDGRDDRGRPAPAGVYLFRLEGVGPSGSGRVVLVR